MTIVVRPAPDSKSQLRKAMDFWDVLLFNIATVLGRHQACGAQRPQKQPECGAGSRRHSRYLDLRWFRLRGCPHRRLCFARAAGRFDDQAGL